MQRFTEVLVLPSQKRDIQDLHACAKLIPCEYQMACLVAFYCKLHHRQTNISNTLAHDSDVYIIQGTAHVHFNHPQKQRVNAPTKVVFKEGMKLTFEQDSVAISITREQANNCRVLGHKTLSEEIQFIRRNSYFAQLSKMVCLKLIYNAQIQTYIRMERVTGDEASLNLIREGEFETFRQECSKVDSEIFRYQNALMTFTPSCLFCLTNTTRCKSATGVLYKFSDSFFKNFIEVVCGQGISNLNSTKETYIQRKARSVDTTKRNSLSYLTQIKFRVQPKEKLRPPSQTRYSFKLKHLRPKPSGVETYNYQQIQRLQEKRNRCLTFRKLYPLQMVNRGEVLGKMYQSIKRELEHKEKDKRELKKTLVF